MSTPLSAIDIVSKAASVVLHPLLLPVYCTLLVLYTPTPYAGLPVSFNAYVLGIVGIFGSLLPLLIIGAFMLVGLVSDISMPTRSERILPLLATALSMCCAAGYVWSLLPTPILGVVLGEGLVLFAAAVWSFFWKVSLHAMGAGGLLAVIWVVGAAYGQDCTLGAAAAFVWAGVTAWTRLHERAHSPLQLLAGYVAGFTIMGLSMLLLLHRVF